MLPSQLCVACVPYLIFVVSDPVPSHDSLLPIIYDLPVASCIPFSFLEDQSYVPGNQKSSSRHFLKSYQHLMLIVVFCWIVTTLAPLNTQAPSRFSANKFSNGESHADMMHP